VLARGLVDATGGFTDAGWPYDALSADELAELTAGLEPIAAAVQAVADCTAHQATAMTPARPEPTATHGRPSARQIRMRDLEARGRATESCSSALSELG